MTAEKYIVTDMDGTLYSFAGDLGRAATFDKSHFFKDLKQSTLKYLYEQCGVPESKVEAEYTRLTQEFGFVSNGIGPVYGKMRDEFYALTWGSLHPQDYIKADPELPHLVTPLEGRLAVLTAAPKVWALPVLQHLGIADVAAQKLFTADEAEPGKRKPHPEAFLHVMRAFGVSPEQGIAIGDQDDTDIVPAKAAGLLTVHVGSNTQDSNADHIAADFKEALAVLRALSLI